MPTFFCMFAVFFQKFSREMNKNLRIYLTVVVCAIIALVGYLWVKLFVK